LGLLFTRCDGGWSSSAVRFSIDFMKLRIHACRDLPANTLILMHLLEIQIFIHPLKMVSLVLADKSPRSEPTVVYEVRRLGLATLSTGGR